MTTPQGLGAGDSSLPIEVEEWLRMGYPVLALARLVGTPMQPWVFNVRATFDSPDVSTVPGVLTDDTIITTDTIIDSLMVRISNDSVPQNVFRPQSDFYTNWQSGIEATLEVTGQPKYNVTADFTPLSTLAEIINPAKWPHAWVLSYTNSVKMNFFARVALANFPTTVVCTFRGFQPVGQRFTNMTAPKAIEELKALGVNIPDFYKTRTY
jgi:hypothetical protein